MDLIWKTDEGIDNGGKDNGGKNTIERIRNSNEKGQGQICCKRRENYHASMNCGKCSWCLCSSFYGCWT